MAAWLCRKALSQFRNNIQRLKYSTGYIVLIPETPEDILENEILTNTGHLLQFDKVTPKDCKHLLIRKTQMYDVGSLELSEDIKQMLERGEKIDIFKNILGPLELVHVPFFTAWGLVETLHHANSDLMPLKMYSALHAKSFKAYRDKFGLEPIYRACKQHLEKEENNCTEEEKRVLQRYVWEGRMAGLDLVQKDKNTVTRMMERTNVRKSSYYHKWMNSMFQFQQLVYDEKIIDDFPVDFLRNTAANVEEPEKGPWVVTLKRKVLSRFLEYCDYRQARLHMWLSRRQICSKHGDQRFRADMEVEDIRNMRTEFANLLGFPTHAHLVIKSRMSENLDSVYDMMDGLLEKAKIGQEIEIYEIEQYAREHNFMGQLELWDIDYWGRLHKKELYHFDERALQEYFPLSQVLLGLFTLCEQLFGIVIEEEKNASTWHQDARYFRVFDERTKQELGGFFFDPYARKNKIMEDEHGGHIITVSVRSKICNTLPSISLIFDFSPPTENKPSLLLFKEVKDLFYKFGIALQHILTAVDTAELSCVIKMEQDALRISGKFMELWLHDRGTLESISGHYNTGEPLPSHILEGICQMHQHLAGTKLCEKLYFARLDLELSRDTEFCMPIAQNLWVNHFLFDFVDVDHHPFSLKDLFIDSDGCTYYGSLWAEAVAADAFSAFQEAGLRNHEEISLLGRRYRSTYFALGAGCHPKEVFRRFRGRNLSFLPLLDTLGLKDLQPTIETTEPPKLQSG